MTFSKFFGKKTLEVSKLTVADVERLMHKAEVAEDRKIPEAFLGAGTELHYGPVDRSEWRDGVWMCCHKHENFLQHYKGAFPFKHLTCGTCNHVLCKECETTEVILPLQGGNHEMNDDGSEPRFFQVCPSCGLSHRAENRRNHGRKKLTWMTETEDSQSTPCPCGTISQTRWGKYEIGLPWSFRLDPVQSAHNASMRLTDRRLQSEIVSRRSSFQEQVVLKPVNARPLLQRDYRSSTTALQRAGAVRGRGAPRLPRSITHQLPPTAGRPDIGRAETWTTAEEHRRLNEPWDSVVINP
ncbi:hypothetical protein E8E13_007753 [Curvularia kusanoi]|uniref:Probable double zinc ribbon domain-containing protein n=1 Tax=Curvularia kusanoi TaxID=90978 RepID=A0A9P4WCI9_CURKU|nr:hypothetical protein E8E13_007753 [Curvularia kusanoi]